MLKLIRSEPVTFWSGFVGAGLTLATQFGLHLPQPEKSAIITLVIGVVTLISRSQSTPNAKVNP